MIGVSMTEYPKLFATRWLAAWAVAISLAWLLPNHYPPWTTFQSDAWVALLLLAAYLTILIRSDRPVSWSVETLVVLGLLATTMIQHLSGQITFFGEAWIVGAYLLGLALALQAGAIWEAGCPGQALDGLALAVGLAGVISVAIQLVQWLDLGGLGLAVDGTPSWNFWVADLVGNRPSANLGQPNLLATLLLWSVLSVAWGFHRGKIGPITAVLLVLYLLIGVVLTRSRTAWLGVAALVVASWYWSHLWSSRRFSVVVSAIALMFAAASLFQLIGGNISLEPQAWQLDPNRLEAGQRPTAWRLFFDAMVAKPWFGYGWNQTTTAYLGLVDAHPPLFGVFSHSHNLFLELMLSCGIPIGLAVSGLIVCWGVKMFRRALVVQDAIALLFLVILGIHAMLEAPLVHGYLLFPAGLIAGSLQQRLSPGKFVMAGRASMLILGIAALGALALTTRDYLGQVEGNFQAMRFEDARIGTLPKAQAPDVLLLTQLREWLRLARYVPRSGMSEKEIRWVRDVTERYPMPDNLFKLAQTLALNDQPQAAAQWLRRTRKVITPDQWNIVETNWRHAAKTERRMAITALPGPEK